MQLKQTWFICGVFFLLLCFILPFNNVGDNFYWGDWAYHLPLKGIAHCYSIKHLNYNPLYLYVLRIFAYFVPPDRLYQNIIYLKIFTLLFDFGAIIILIKWINKYNINYFNVFFILFNIAYLYNTLVWGQIDAIHTTLVFAAGVALIEKRLILSIILLLLALNIKTQAIIFLPVFIFIWVPLFKIAKPLTLIKTIIAIVALQALILLPFILEGTLAQVWANVSNTTNYYPYISLHAYNFWFIFNWEGNPDILFAKPDTGVFCGPTYKTWGLGLFLLSSAIALFPLLVKTLLYYIKGIAFSFVDAAQSILALTLVSLLFFYFPTQMHERYAHPAELFAGVYFILSKRWVPFLLISYAYFMNLEVAAHVWKLNYGTFIFDPRLIACAYTAAIGLGIWYMYRSYNFKGDWRELKEVLSKK